MKTVKLLIVGLCITSFASCSLEDDPTMEEVQDIEIKATGDEGDDPGTPGGRSAAQDSIPQKKV